MSENRNKRWDDNRARGELNWTEAAKADLVEALRVPGVRTWRQRIGVGKDWPLHAPNDVERAMVAEIAELRLAAAKVAALAPKAETPAPVWGRVQTVGDMVRNLLALDQGDTIHSAFFLDFDGKRRCRTLPITISRERVIDGKWVDSTRKDVPYATVVWAKPDERADQLDGRPGEEP